MYAINLAKNPPSEVPINVISLFELALSNSDILAAARIGLCG